jgi:cell division protease FtsH
VTTGAHDDIRKATDLARRMVTEYGMSPAIGAVDYGTETRANPFGIGPTHAYTQASPETAEQIEREIHAFLDRCHQRAREILLENRGIMEEMAQTLLEREVLDGTEMEAFLDRVARADELAEPPTGELMSVS